MDAYNLQQKINSYLTGLPDYSARPYQVRMSGAGDCPRLMDYLMRDGVKAPEINHIMRMHTGTYLHNMWRDIKQGAFGDDYFGSEEEVTITLDNGVVVMGHPDGQFREAKCLDEFKSVSDSSFKMIINQGAPIPAHYEQANTYCGSLGLESMLIHYFNKDTGESHFFFAPYNSELFSLTKQKFVRRFDNKERGLIESRPHNDPTASPCWFCPKLAECYSGFKDEVSSMGRATYSETDQPELLGLVSEAVTARATRLECEKKEKANKSSIADVLIKLGVKSCDVGEFSCELKLGKNNNPLLELKEKR